MIHTVVERLSDLGLNVNLTQYILYQYSKILELFPAQRHSNLPIENQFFIQFFYNMLFPDSKLKFFSLWRRIRSGSLSVGDAVTFLPKRDMRMAELKAKHAEMAKKTANTVDTAQ